MGAFGVTVVTCFLGTTLIIIFEVVLAFFTISSLILGLEQLLCAGCDGVDIGGFIDAL